MRKRKQNGIDVMKINCGEYRKSMELLSLKIQLERGGRDKDELDKIRKRIEDLQRELKLD
jgi:hypothetical protein